MHQDTRKIAGHMREFGCYTAGRAFYHSQFDEMGGAYRDAIAVTLAAHAAEIIIKARIAQEHPLLIFDSFPKPEKSSGLLNLPELFEYGKTVMYSELPQLLWATTGYRIKRIAQFNEFGKLRNKIMHFAVPDAELGDQTLCFIFEFIDVLLKDFWDDTIISYAEQYDDYFLEDDFLSKNIKRLNIKLTKTSRLYLKEKANY